MNDRKRAIAILREAKQILSDRLTERVLEAGEEILADARGDSYMNDIEAVYEQVGMKLAHVNQMLSNLPAEPSNSTAKAAPGRPATVPPADPAGDAVNPGRSTRASGTAALPPPAYRVSGALPAPAPKAANDVIPLPHRPSGGAPPRSFQTFASQIEAGDLLSAGRSLAGLFELPEARAIACASVFADRLRREPDFIRRATQLRLEIEEGGYNRAIVLLHDCFGLTATESITVLQSLRRRLRPEY